MNRSIRTTAITLLSAVATFAATSAFADGDVPSYPQALTVGKSRMEVRAEFDQARAAGQLIVNEASLLMPAAQVNKASATSRDDVKQALRQAIASGELNALTAEPQGFAGAASKVTRKAAQTTAAARG